MSSERLFRFPKPQWLNSANTRSFGVYLAGALFSIALFVMIDAAVFSKSDKNGSDVHINFIDWIPGIFSALGMLIINSIDKTRLSADNFSYRGDGVAWKARVVLFMGFAAMAGGLAGGVVSNKQTHPVPGLVREAHGQVHVRRYEMRYEMLANTGRQLQTVMVLKYVVPEYPFPTLWFGVANVIANSLISLSSVILWVSQNMEDDYTYNLQL
ncbi:hypothetical protein MBLNU459_g5234t1 [Dothideomycetes sp. NU459]